ncbi:hypothetical protein GGQ74_000646 [Desulfobaculum xiamenense]|uniref:DUF4079 domain-containing protein n=1 Tax=Desulfobaculum xiamenense TaxID=995050 RepID=A0A846QE52_9BACT|nr:DUF4079 domain-containing protein [Desulfobaculum xiamenense]NJB67006.1 hypothetical protein [Desulfobaculum xiamenense]
MLLFHPVSMVVVNLLSLYVLHLGARRFRMAHFGQPVRFAWRRHVTLGLVVLCGWGLGMAGAMAITWHFWERVGATGWHFVNAAGFMAPLLFVGLASGVYMDRRRGRRVLLPVLHGLCNVVLVTLAMGQVFTGWHALVEFVF